MKIEITMLKKLIFLLIIFYIPACSAERDYTDFSIFWKDFRQALLDKNYKSIAKLSKLPLEAKGATDSVPLKYYKSEELKELFTALLKQVDVAYKSGGKIERTLLERLKDTVAVNEKPIEIETGNYLRLDELVFKSFDDGRWYLVRVYYDEL